MEGRSKAGIFQFADHHRRTRAFVSGCEGPSQHRAANCVHYTYFQDTRVCMTRNHYSVYLSSLPTIEW